jgi:hypothetical protein
MNQIPINEEKNLIYNKKAIKIILLLTLLGIITGLILSYVFIDEANQRIENIEERDVFFPPEADFNPQPLTISDIILPSIGVIIICISAYLLIGLIIVYIRIFLKTNSKYIIGLLFFLIPFFIQSILSVNTLRSLFVSPAIPYMHIRESIGFGLGGLGGILVMVSIFEIIGLSILLYLSTE